MLFFFLFFINLLPFFIIFFIYFHFILSIYYYFFYILSTVAVGFLQVSGGQPEPVMVQTNFCSGASSAHSLLSSHCLFFNVNLPFLPLVSLRGKLNTQPLTHQVFYLSLFFISPLPPLSLLVLTSMTA